MGLSFKLKLSVQLGAICEGIGFHMGLGPMMCLLVSSVLRRITLMWKLGLLVTLSIGVSHVSIASPRPLNDTTPGTLFGICIPSILSLGLYLVISIRFCWHLKNLEGEFVALYKCRGSEIWLVHVTSMIWVFTVMFSHG